MQMELSKESLCYRAIIQKQYFIVDINQSKPMYLTSQSPRLIANSSNHNVIPKNLLLKSVHQNGNEQWLRRTYQYYSCIDKTVKSKGYKDDEGLQQQRNCVVMMIDDLKNIGYAKAKNEIVRITNDRLELKTIDNKQIRK